MWRHHLSPATAKAATPNPYLPRTTSTLHSPPLNTTSSLPTADVIANTILPTRLFKLQPRAAALVACALTPATESQQSQSPLCGA